MNAQILALYDLTGIQRYIFQTSKLKDIIGASELVGNALQEKIEETPGSKNLLYTGGGNAVLGFAGKEEWKAFNTAFSKKLLLEIPGLSFVTVCNDEAGDKISVRIEDLFAEIARKKSLGGDDCSITTLPPMAQSASERLPVVIIAKEGEDADVAEYSHPAWVKWEKGKEKTSESDHPVEFDNIAEKPKYLKKAERIMAVVHIDGNQMGNLFMKACEKADSLEDIKALSEAIDAVFNTAYRDFFDKCHDAHERWRKIYVSGDDVTYVCHGVYALKSAVNFLKALDDIRKNYPQLQGFSASAGIAYVKPHFPFYKAYERAERCCKEAKIKAREQAGSSWVNFEIVRGSLNADASKLLRNRPYCVTGHGNRDYKKLLEWLEIINGGAGARSKWKELRNAYLMGNADSVKLLMGSRGMPDINGEDPIVLDALDLMDVEVK